MKLGRIVLGLMLPACASSAPQDRPSAGGSAPAPCEPGTRELAPGDCEPAGVPAEACGDGFASDGNQGCRAILPERGCPRGTMAVPGDDGCREVAPCGRAPWGDIPVDADTQYVDASYRGGDSNGSATKPWLTVQQAVDAAASSAIVAVAAGVYSEDIVVAAKAIRLWGRCPSMVSIAGVSSTGRALRFVDSIGSEAHGVAIEGPAHGLVIAASDVQVDGVWVHDAGGVGVQLEGESTAAIEGSLVEDATEVGINSDQSDVSVTASVIRGTLSRGVNVQEWYGRSATAVITGSLLEQNGDVGVFAGGSIVTVDSSVVRDTPAVAPGGGAIIVRASSVNHVRSVLTLQRSVVERNRKKGVAVGSSSAHIEATTIRDTLPDDMNAFGVGLMVSQLDPEAGPPDASLSTSLLERNHYIALQLAGGTMMVDAVAIRDTQPRASDQLGGRGINTQSSLGIASTLTVIDSSVERNFEIGISLSGPTDIDHTRVVRVFARPDGLGGDALAAWQEDQPVHLSVKRSLIAEGARAGITSFSASAALRDLVLDCNTIHLNGTDSGYGPFAFDDQDGNICGCRGETVPCQVLSEQLEPPSQLDPPGP